MLMTAVGHRERMASTPSSSANRLRRAWRDLQDGWTDDEREDLAELLACRLDGLMTALGILFALVVLGQTLAPTPSALATGLFVLGWVLWAVFAVEFLARLVIAPSTSAFLRRNWWQLLFLAVPFLRFARVLAVARAGRAGSVISSAVRSSRSTRGLLTSRLSWLVVVTGIVVLAASQLLYAFTDTGGYARALHAATYAVLIGEPVRFEGVVARVLELFLAAWSILVVAGVAAALGAFFVSHGDPRLEQA